MKDVNIDFKKIYELRISSQIAIICSLFFVLFLLLYFVILSAFKDKITSEIQDEDKLRSQLITVLQQKSALQNKVLELPQLKDKLKNWQSRIIQGKEYPALEKTLLKYGEDNQIKITGFTPAKIIKRNGFRILPVKITIESSYNEIGSYMGYLANQEKLIVINTFTMEQELSASNNDVINFLPLNSNHPFKAEINIEIYEQ